MIEKDDLRKKIDSLSLKTYGPRRIAAMKDTMTRDEMIAMSPLGASQPTKMAKKFAKHREVLPPILKKALNYLYPSKDYSERPSKSKYDSMVRKMSDMSLTPVVGSLSPKVKHGKKSKIKDTFMKKMNGMFDFPKLKGELLLEKLEKGRSRSTLKLPKIPEAYLPIRHTSFDYVNCLNYTGEAESEYLKTGAGQKEYKSLYEMMLIDSGLYAEIRIRGQTKKKSHYRRMPA